MISSRERAPEHGGAHLIVDGIDAVVHRKAQFALFLKPAQEKGLHRLLGVLVEVYNAALEERRSAYAIAGVSVSLFDQFRQVKDLRGVRDDVLAFGIQPVRIALKRLDEAFQAFFRRIRNGETPGFPRFRSDHRYNTASWDEPRSWALVETGGRRVVRISGVGDVPVSKRAGKQLARLEARGGVAATLTVTRRRASSGFVWRATIGYKNVAAQKLPETGRLVGVDRGVAVTAATSDGDLHTYPQLARTLRAQADALGEAKSGKKRGSRAWIRISRDIAKLRRRAANLVDDWARQAAIDIVAKADVIVLEDLRPANMTKSAKGTVDKPGVNVAAKARLNREMLAAGLGRLHTRICVKAEEAGRRCWIVNAKYTSRTCAACGHVAKASRVSQAEFVCVACGHAANADVNAAINIAVLGGAAEAAWRAAGEPGLTRRAPRLRRRKARPAAA